ncbi:MAG: NACHT domain-containing protein, partial [Desulfobacterales bacterium]|nr:NACHT domain-containing protein [Desulfobacterales bacterium]
SRGVGVTQTGGAGKPVRGDLEEMYVPLRLGEGFDINELDRGAVLSPADLARRETPLAIRGNAGAGKTTWMRWTFRRLLDNEAAFPIMVELRRLMRDWKEHPDQARNLETYMEKWIADFVGEKWADRLSDALAAKDGPRPVLLVDGWDELGDLGEELRAKLVGLMRTYPALLVVVSSRPYGEGRPSNSEGFEVLDIQPLDDDEVKTLAGHFFTLCHPKDPKNQEETTVSFLEALERSVEAQALGRTALLLTMMLLISRTSPLPDKRHQLYQRCIENLLTTLPDHYEHEGVRKTSRQWRPEDGDERFREVANLAFQAQNKGYESKSRGAIILKKDEMAAMLPRDRWTAQQRRHFINWLAERAEVLVDRVDDTFTFAHLSFQEYLTAWRLDADIEGEEARIEAFIKRASDMKWWETLRLWAAVIESKNPDRLKPVLEKLIKGNEKFFYMAGAMLADGLG